MRAHLFSTMGVEGADLMSLQERELDEQHTIVTTVWKARMVDESAAPLQLRSTFLLRQEDGRWSIAVYLNHQDLARLHADRTAS